MLQRCVKRNIACSEIISLMLPHCSEPFAKQHCSGLVLGRTAFSRIVVWLSCSLLSRMLSPDHPPLMFRGKSARKIPQSPGNPLKGPPNFHTPEIGPISLAMRRGEANPLRRSESRGSRNVFEKQHSTPSRGCLRSANKCPLRPLFVNSKWFLSQFRRPKCVCQQ